MTDFSVVVVGTLLRELASELSTAEYPLTAEDILENLERRSIGREEARQISEWLST